MRNEGNGIEEILTPEEQERAKAIAAEYGTDTHGYGGISIETIALLGIITALLVLVIYLFVFPPPQPPPTITGPITTFNASGAAVTLYPGTEAYNMAKLEIEAPSYSAYNSQLAINKSGTFLFLLLMFAGFLYARRYVMTATEMSWQIYLFVVTSFLGWGAATGIIAIILGNSFLYGAFGGSGGLFYAFWKLQDRGFV